jgi:16S rRNA (adenine1518-N6/adenine1519-N6)-dimethyltransferase
VVDIEFVSGFFRELQTRFESVENVELIHADALKFNFRELADRIGRLRVVANLPYNVSSRLVFMFQENSDIFSSLTIMLQKEVAERFMADPGGKEYGPLSVLLGLRSRVLALFDIPGRAFYPVPAVDSTLIRVDFTQSPNIQVVDFKLLTRLVKTAFASRRKTLRNNLKSFVAQGIDLAGLNRAAADSGVDLSRRAETLTPSEFAALSNEISREINKI